MWFVQPLLWWKFRDLGEPLFTDLDHRGFLSSKTTSPRRRWLMTFKISFLGFRVTLGAKAIGFWSNMKTFCHLTHSNAQLLWQDILRRRGMFVAAIYCGSGISAASFKPSTVKFNLRLCVIQLTEHFKWVKSLDTEVKNEAENSETSEINATLPRQLETFHATSIHVSSGCPLTVA